jgi:hypothetical protein
MVLVNSMEWGDSYHMIWICLAIPTVLFLAIKEILFQPEQTSGRIVPIRRDQELERNRLRKLRDQERQELHLIATEPVPVVVR